MRGPDGGTDKQQNGHRNQTHGLEPRERSSPSEAWEFVEIEQQSDEEPQQTGSLRKKTPDREGAKEIATVANRWATVSKMKRETQKGTNAAKNRIHAAATMKCARYNPGVSRALGELSSSFKCSRELNRNTEKSDTEDNGVRMRPKRFVAERWHTRGRSKRRPRKTAHDNT